MNRPKRRMLDPSIWSDPEFGELTALARILFVGLISLADDDGRLEADPRRLRAVLFGYDDLTAANVQALLEECAEAGLVGLYDVEGRQCAFHPNWTKYQQISPTKRTPSALPGPDGEPAPDGGGNGQPETERRKTAPNGAERRKDPARGGKRRPKVSISKDKKRKDITPQPPALSGESVDNSKLSTENTKNVDNSPNTQVIILSFPTMPDDNTRNRLRLSGFDWNPERRQWIAEVSPGAEDVAEQAVDTYPEARVERMAQ